MLTVGVSARVGPPLFIYLFIMQIVRMGKHAYREKIYTKRTNKMKNEKKMERKRPRASIESISQQIRQNVVDFAFRKIVQL
jgi:hypothetical protein